MIIAATPGRGVVPRELGQLVNLEVLFLSNDKLIGNITYELSHLDKLQELNISENQITSSIDELKFLLPAFE
jgi:Leucine-rich repeat (LRR) protein